MFFKYFLSLGCLCFLLTHNVYSQKVAEFCFCNTTDVPNSLLENLVGTNAIAINANVNSDGEGIYTIENENISMHIPQSIFEEASSIRMRFDFMNHETFSWLINGGFDRFRLGNITDDAEDTHGLWLRYYVYEDLNDNGVLDVDEQPSLALIDSNLIPGSRVTKGERATVEFNYNHETGIAQVIKNGVVVWETPADQQAPGKKFLLDAEDGVIVVGDAMDGEGSTTPSLYSFEGWIGACEEVTTPTVEEGERCGEGRVTLKAIGATEGNFLWYNPVGDLIENEINDTYTTPSISESQTYFVSIMENGCESEKTPVKATVFSIPNAPQVTNAKNCGPGELTLVASGASEGSYRWYTSNDTSTPMENTYGSNFTTQFLSETTEFYVAVVNENCESIKVKVEAVINEIPAPPDARDIEICEPGEIELTIDKNDETTLWWYRSATIGEVMYEDEEGFFNPTAAGDTTFYVSAHNGSCESPRVAYNVKIQTPSFFDAGDDVRKFYEDSVQLRITGDEDLGDILWHPSTGLSDPSVSDPVAFPERTTTYTVSAINSNGCEVSDNITVFVAEFPVPNAFSPNNDGLNDTWEIPYINRYPDCEVVVYNRWGNAIYQSKGYKEAWDGRFEGKIVATGKYVYYINLNNGKAPLRGMLYVKR